MPKTAGGRVDFLAPCIEGCRRHTLTQASQLQGKQLALRQRLLRAYFTEGEDVSSHEILARLAAEIGLDAERVRAILADGHYADEVRAQEQLYLQHGIHSVPATIINQQHLIAGG